MKNLILCEGKHDIAFFEAIFGNCLSNCYFNLPEQAKITENKYAESTTYTSFKQPSSPYINLFKSEGGKDKVLKILKVLRQDLLLSQKHIKLIVDLDCDLCHHTKKFTSIMNEWLKKGACGQQYTWNKKILHDHNDFVIYEADILNEENSVVITNMRMILFKKTLEIAAGGKTKDEIMQYASSPEVNSKIKEVLFTTTNDHTQDYKKITANSQPKSKHSTKEEKK